MGTLVQYATSRYFQKSHGWGKPWVRWLLLDAALFALARYYTLLSPAFRRWCREVNQIFCDEYDWPRKMTEDTGEDCWIDPYWARMSPQDAVISEVEHWEN